MDKKFALNIPKQSNLEEIDVPFVYGGDHGDIESHAKVTIDSESKTYEINNIYPNDIDDEWPKEDVRDWMRDQYPDYTEI